MNAVFMNSKNSKRLILTDYHYCTEKINLKRSHKYVPLSNLSIYYKWKNIKNSYKKNKFKISALWNEQFELPDGSSSISDIWDSCKYIFKKHEEKLLILQ